MPGDGFDLRGELFEAVGFGDVGGNAQATQLLALCRADAAGPEQQQIRLEAEQALHVQLTITAHRRQVAQLKGTLTGIKHAHQQVGRSQFNDDFREGRRQADHPLHCGRRAADGQQHNRQPVAHQAS
ncbi:hypothetical protein D3C86_1732500 [compost metagenome]